MKHITVSYLEGLAELVLKRPPVNVLNIEMMQEITDALNEIQSRDDLKALLIKAEGKAFSAGVDVSEHTEEMVEEMISVFHGMIDAIIDTEIVTVAAVNGACLGGGCELACVCDIVLASEKAKFGQPEIQVGVFPPVAAAYFPFRIGLSKTFEMCLTGETIKAGEALRIGLVNHVYPVEDFDDKVKHFVAKFLDKSAAIIKLTKEAIGYYGSLEDVEEVYLEKLMKTKDAHEGLKAFLEKRQPKWNNQ